MQMPEEQLVARCRAGDLDALGQVYERYERHVFRYAYYLLGQREEADDIKQETFLRAYQSIGKFRSRSSLQTWLLAICGNLCRDRIRSWERRKIQYHAQLGEDHLRCQSEMHDPVALLERSLRSQVVMGALQRMPLAHREVLVLHDIEGLSYEEIAQIRGGSVASVKLRVFRARRYLKERLTALLRVKE